MKRIAAALLAVALVANGCWWLTPPGWLPPDSTSSPSPAASPGAEPTPSEEPLPTPTPTPEPTPPGGLLTLKVGQHDTSPDAPAADVRKLVRGNTDFALDLYQQVRKVEKGNLVVGPYSVSVAFGMLNAGALSRTARQIVKVLHFTLPTDRLDPAFNALSVDLASRANPRLEISIVNRLFGQQLYEFKRAYLRELTQQFDAPMAALDFNGAPEPSRKLINRWVASQTNNRIKDLIAKGMIKRTTAFALVNATYLNARWASQFDPQSTYDGLFHLLGGKTVAARLMFQGISAPALIGPDYQAIELPYKGGKLAMLLVMPKDLKAFERSLDASALSAVIDSLKVDLVDVIMPKFSIRTGTELSEILKGMGMTDAFDRSVADFYAISDYPRDDPSHLPLIVSAVVHQAFIKVGEKGTEAAAATAIIGDSGGGGGEPPPTVRLDHPFLWFIRDRATGTILFMGRVMDPSQTAG